MKTNKQKWWRGLACALFTVVSAQGYAATNLVKNGSFESGLTSWSFLISGGASGIQYQDSASHTDGKYSEALQVRKSISGCAYCAALRQSGLSITAGKSVTVTFAAKASKARSLEVGVQKSASPYTWYSLNYFNLSTRWQTFSFTFTPKTSDNGALLNFDMGDVATTVSIDNVILVSAGTTTPTPTPAPAPTPTPTPAPAPSPSSLAAPAGYSAAQLTFEDKFTASSLNATKWNPYMGDDQYGRWSDQGHLANPYSGMNCNSSCSNSFNIQYYDPYPYGSSANLTGNSLVGGNGNLRFIMKPSNHFSNLGYSFSSASVTSFDKLYLPASGGYIQFRAKMPDSRYGAWAGLWLLSASGPEIDVIESGYTRGSSNPNNVIASNFHGSGASQIIKDSGVDLSAAYHVYGMEYRSGKSIKIYLDGNLIATYTSNIPVNAKYQILMDIEVAGANTNGWHTVADPVNHPGPFYLDVNDVQIYGLP